ncbi:hypothetical protein L195_g035432 [Trifolium pratense]|uniref:Uncharacterized protein n=1 Tax=Trifolium pratense TaxID=57577 RepID=A0A2K3LLN1_TRIPR|nr:hypothetical protein L195_g035432 [Trifolium pratense]
MGLKYNEASRSRQSLCLQNTSSAKIGERVSVSHVEEDSGGKVVTYMTGGCRDEWWDRVPLLGGTMRCSCMLWQMEPWGAFAAHFCIELW